MLLYHGTSERVARLALREGLSPRDDLDENGNWEENPSCGEMVYLTTAYAGFFALNATENGDRWGIIEIDTDRLDEDDLRPDEDFLEQTSRSEENRKAFHAMGVEHDPEDVLALDASMEERTRWVRDHIEFFGPWWGNGGMWKRSLGGIGNCAHVGWIPVGAITRVSFIDPEANPGMALMAADPMITPMNYRCCADKYRALTGWFMGDEVDAAAFTFGGFPVIPPDSLLALPPELRQQAQWQQEAVERTRAALANRAGVEVLIV